ncbi:vacuolar membrane-associated protein iml1 [Microbotryomycetes sp. JL221]|nr:vacuolar membrane-associated protein iml1 [Microbotryomycetes sp. JL221]
MAVFELQLDPQATQDVLVSPAAFPEGTRLNDLLAIRPAHIGKGKLKDRPLLFKVDRIVTEDDDASDFNARRRGKAQVVVASTVAQSFPWIKNRQQVFVTLVESPPPTDMTASHVELYFKDLYLSRPDMFRLTLSLTSQVIHLNQRVTLPGSLARLRVGEIFNQEGHTVRSAYVDDETKIIFRSESARCYVFIEISQEMWQFEEDGSMLREKCEMFLHELFAHWTGKATTGTDLKSKGNPTSHTVSIILYGRVIYEDNGEGEEERAPMRRLEDGTLYRDFYKVILDLTPMPSSAIVRTVAAEIRAWHESVLTRTRPSGELKLAGRIAFAHESPVLEAANLALNSFEEHWVDRDLQRTGLEIIVLTAGTSYYQVPKTLLRLTTERMLYHGIGLDLISLSKTPLHTVPLFSFKSQDPTLTDAPASQIGSTPARADDAYSRDGMSYNSNATNLTGPAATASTTMGGATMASASHTSHPAMSSVQRETPLSRDAMTMEALRLSIPDDQRDPLYYDPDARSRTRESSTYYSEPLFIFCSFFGTQIDKPHRIDRFMPRARCYQLFSQGPNEKMPVSIPLLPAPGNTSEIDKEDEGWGYLSELERRQARREKYDAGALGARDFGEGLFNWRRSGVTSNLSGDSLGRSRESESGVEVEEELSRRTTALGLVVGGRRRAARTVSEAIVSSRQEHEYDRERGREKERAREKVPDTRRVTVSSRSITPVPHKPNPRAPSLAPSIRSNATARQERKASTPALIARLTNPSALATPSAAPAPTPANHRSAGWLGLFGRNTSSVTAAPAPSVAVQKVEAQANTKPEVDLNAPLTPRHSVRSLSPTSSTRRSISGQVRPTQPILIGSKAETASDTSRNVNNHRGSPSMRTFAQSGNSRKSASKIFGSRFNPSKPGGKQSRGLADQARRWASIFIRHSNDQRSVNWVSVARGACLPLTTDYLPPMNVLSSQFSDHRYAVPTSHLEQSFLLRVDSSTSYPALALVIELVSQRLSHGFQLVTPANHFGALDDLHLASTKSLSEVLNDVREGDNTAIFLTLSNQIHRISYDRRTQAVVVRIMRRRRSWLKETYEYSGLIFTQGALRYIQSPIDFPYPNMIEPLDWQHLDRLIAGIEKLDLRPTLRYWRTRLVLLPADSVPDRDYIIARTKALQSDVDPTDVAIQDQGFSVLLEIIENARWVAPDDTKEDIPIVRTTLGASEWAASIAQGSTTSTDKAVAAQPRATSWLSRIRVGDRDKDKDKDKSTENASTKRGDDSNNVSPTRATDSKERPVVQMSYAVILDLDPQQRSARSERVVCHLDRSHNVQAAFHIELNWLAGSGKVIDQAIQSWTRQVARFGLNLVEVTSRAVEDRHNPFQSALHVNLSLPPPDVDEFDPPLPEHYFEEALLKSLHFVLDIGADSTFPPDVDVRYSYRREPTLHSEYIHRSGSVLVAIVGGRSGFAYMPNRIYTSHHPDGARPEDAIAQLVGLCQNPSALSRFWDEVRKTVDRERGTGEISD